jgi:hypothetical protein
VYMRQPPREESITAHGEEDSGLPALLATMAQLLRPRR